MADHMLTQQVAIAIFDEMSKNGIIAVNWNTDVAKAVMRVVHRHLQDHYWDSLEKDKSIIMLHVDAILKE